MVMKYHYVYFKHRIITRGIENIDTIVRGGGGYIDGAADGSYGDDDDGGADRIGDEDNTGVVSDVTR